MPIERLNRTLHNKEGIDNMKDVRMRTTMETCDNMADEGIVYPTSSDKVDSVVLAKEIAEMAIDFENGKYEKFDWLEEVETYVRDHFIWSEYAIKGED